MPYRHEARVLVVALHGNEVADPHGHVRKRVDVGIKVALLHLPRIAGRILKDFCERLCQEEEKRTYKTKFRGGRHLGFDGQVRVLEEKKSQGREECPRRSSSPW